MKICSKVFLVLSSFALQVGDNVSLGWSPLYRCQSQPVAPTGFCSVFPVKPKRESSRKCLDARFAGGCSASLVGSQLPWSCCNVTQTLTAVGQSLLPSSIADQ